MLPAGKNGEVWLEGTFFNLPCRTGVWKTGESGQDCGGLARPERVNDGPFTCLPVLSRNASLLYLPSSCGNLQSRLLFHFAKRNSGLICLVCKFSVRRTVQVPCFKTRTPPVVWPLPPRKCGPVSGTCPFQFLRPLSFATFVTG